MRQNETEIQFCQIRSHLSRRNARHLASTHLVSRHIHSFMVWSQVSIENIARDVAALAGVSHLLEFDTSKADGQFRKPASCDVLTSKLPEVGDGSSRAIAFCFV